MSWMDSWSRPKKTAVTPPPLYLTHESVLYCHSCGRVISTRRSETAKASATPVKYCSDRCRNRKPGRLDRRLEALFVALLDGADPDHLAAHPERLALDTPLPPHSAQNVVAPAPAKQKKKHAKGDPRLTVVCADVEAIVFGSRYNPEKSHGRKRNRPKRTIDVDEEADEADAGKAATDHSDSTFSTAEASADDTEDEDEAVGSDEGSEADNNSGGVALPSTAPNVPAVKASDVPSDHKGFGAGKVRPAQIDAEVNFSVGGERGWAEKLEETPEMLAKRREGQKRADEREMVRCAARRLCAFGYPMGEGEGGVEKPDEEDGNTKGKKKSKKGAKADVAGDGEQRGKKERRKKCEAVMNAAVVEASFAKGDWGIRWREDQDL